jgi:hypothetical protein
VRSIGTRANFPSNAGLQGEGTTQTARGGWADKGSGTHMWVSRRIRVLFFGISLAKYGHPAGASRQNALDVRVWREIENLPALIQIEHTPPPVKVRGVPQRPGLLARRVQLGGPKPKLVRR